MEKLLVLMKNNSKSDINAGIYCFNRTAIDKIDKKKFNIINF